MQLLARHRVCECWLVDPEALTIEEYSLTGQHRAVSSTASGPGRVRSLLLIDLALLPADLVRA